jgi:hypothetical protein
MKLIVSDHTHCFTCGRDLNDHVAAIDRVRDERLYGVFPAFVQFLNPTVIENFCDTMRNVARADVIEVLRTVPAEWEVTDNTRVALEDLILRRATFVADNIHGWLFP